MSQKKSHETIVDDIMELVDKPHTLNEENFQAFIKDIEETFRNMFSHSHKGDGNHLRISNFGQPPRKLWYTLNRQEKIKPETRIKFLFGHIIESLVLLLVKEAGHEVTHEQHKANYEGIPGSMDCVIDGVPYDIKGLSETGIRKFKKGTIFKEDTFSYLPQITAYFTSGKKEGIVNSNVMGFLALSKIFGNITNFIMDEMEAPDIASVAKRAKSVQIMLEPPEEKCYEPNVHQKNGNVTLNKNCAFCQFKDECWADANDGQGLRRFQYSHGVEYFVDVKKEPRVDEIFKDAEEEVEIED